MAVAVTLAGLIRSDQRKFIFHHAFHHAANISATVTIGKVHIYAHIGKTLHGTGAYTANHDCLYSVILEKLHRDHATAGTMILVSYSGHFFHCAILDFHQGKNITVAKMIGPTGINSSGIIRGHGK
jgi:hypothetical protein